jgi:hypothetical protein
MTVTVLPVRPDRSLQGSLKRFLQYERQSGNAAYVKATWTRGTLGGRTALGTVIRPSTEGGVSLSYGVYVAPWRTHVYQVTVVAYGKPVPSSLRAFPAVYGQMLKTWRFL